MIKFKKNNETGSYDVIGPVSELQLGPVRVVKKDGSSTTVTVTKLSGEFDGRFGDLEGQRCVIGTIEATPPQRGEY